MSYYDNPFIDSFQFVCKSLIDDPTLRFVHRDLPKGMAAGYLFPPINIILNPRVNTMMLTRKEQRKYTANTYHELRHHALSSKEQTERSARYGKFLYTLAGVIEDARIEICPLHVLQGGKEDLTEDRLEEFQEYLAARDFQELDPWGFLCMNIVMTLPGYGELPVKKPLKKLWQIAKDILYDGRFEAACQMGREGHKVSVDLALEIARAWQQEEELPNMGGGSGNGDQEGEETDANSEGSGADSGSNSNSGAKARAGKNISRDGSGRDSNPPSSDQGASEDQDRSQHDDGEVPDSDSSHDRNVDLHDSGSEDETDRGAGKRGKTEPSDSESSTDRDSGNEDEGKTDGGNAEDGNDDGDSSAGSDLSEDLREESGRTDDGEETEETDNQDEENDDEGFEEAEDFQEFLKKLEEEYSQANENSPFDPGKLGKEVAELGPEGNPDDFVGNWWADEKNTKEGGHLSNRNSGIYIPYNAQDRIIIPNEFEKEFDELESKIRDKVTILQQSLTALLRAKSQDVYYRNRKRGEIDELALYKIPSGSKRIKMRIKKGLDLGAAVTLLIDLSGSMNGEKATLAAQIATLFGETLLDIPEVAYEVWGYNSSPLINGQFVTRDGYKAMETKLMKDGFSRTEMINYWSFKRFDEDWRMVRYRMGACARSMVDSNPAATGAVGGCNVDHENLYKAAYHLAERPEERKLLVVLCDGQPSGCGGNYGGLLDRELNRVVKKIRDAGIRLFCYGIKDSSVKKYYNPDVEIVQNLKNLDEKSLTKLAEFLLQDDEPAISNFA